MLDAREPRTGLTRRFLALMGALLLLVTGGLLVAAPATADDDDPVAWEWTSAAYWQTTFQAGLPNSQYWLATTSGGGGAVTFAATPYGETTATLADLDLSISNFNATVVEIAGTIGDDVVPGVYQYTITATGADATTASMVFTITIAPPLVFDGPPQFSGPTDWYVSSPGTYDVYPVVDGAEVGHVTFPTQPYNNLWEFCSPYGSWWGGGPPSIGFRCVINELPEDGTHVFEIHASNDNGTTVYTGRLHIGSFTAPTIDAASEVKVGVGRAFPSFVPTLTGDPAPTVTIAPSGDNELPLDFLGLSLDPATGAITGTVPESTPLGSYEYTLTVTGSATDTHELTIVVGRAPVFTGPTAVSGLRGASLDPITWTWATDQGITYTFTDIAALDDAGLEVRNVFSSLPDGILEMSVITVYADAPLGTQDVRFGELRNEFGSTDLILTLIFGDLPVIEASTPSTIIATVGTPIAPFSPTTSGGTPTDFSLTRTSGPDIDGLLPAGLTFNTATGAITGTATDASQVGTYAYSLVASNSFGESEPRAVTVRVGQPPTVTHAARDFYVTRGASIPDGSIEFTGATTFSTSPSPGLDSVLTGGVIMVNNNGVTWDNLEIQAGSPLGTVEYRVITVNDFGSTTATLRFHVMDEVTIDGDASRAAQQGQPIADWIPTVGGDGDVTLSVDDLAGLEDLGLDFDTETGAITGTLSPDAPVGDHEFEVTATGPQNTASTSVTITVEPRPVALDLTRLGADTVLQGGSVTVEVEVTDSLGNSTSVPAADLGVTSSVDTDEIDVEDGKFTVTFPHASPHTITVTQLSTGLTADITIEVTPVDDLSDTGIDPVLPLGIATALVLLGATLMVVRRRA